MALNIAVQETPTGRPSAAVDLGNGRTIWLHSRYDPEAEARALVDRYDLADVSQVLVIGHGLGYHVAELHRRLPEAHIEVIDPHPEVAQVGRQLGVAPEVPVLRPTEVARLALMIHRASRAESRLCIVEHPASLQLYPDLAQEIRHFIKDILNSYRVNTHTWRGLGLRFNANIALNLQRIARDPGVIHLEGSFTGRPAIMVASGPSLSKNVHCLQAAAGRAVIIAAGSAYEALSHHGIVPDLVVSVDPTDANLQHFVGRGDPQVALVYETRCTPGVIDEFTGPRFVCVHASPVSQFAENYLGPKGQLSMGGTVATAAFSLARFLGCDPIISVGQDLANTGNVTHASGMACQEPVATDGQTLWVEGMDGQPLPTTPALASFKFQMENLYGSAVRQGIRVVDATEGGARKKHTEIMTLQAAIEQFCTEPFAVREPLAEVYRGQQPPETDVRRFALALNRKVAALAKLSKRLLPAAERIHRLQQRMAEYDNPQLADTRPELARECRSLFDEVYRENQAIVAQGKTARLVELATYQIMRGPKPEQPTTEDKLSRNLVWYLELAAALHVLVPKFETSAMALLPQVPRPRRAAVGG